MKGIVFAEFLEMVESQHGLEMVDAIIDDARPPSGGAYAATGTYDHRELVSLVDALGRRTGAEPREVLIGFGRHLMPRFRTAFPSFFEHAGLFDFLESVHDYIHVEVRKLHPEAELPSITCEDRDDRRMVLLYESRRDLADFGRGLIEGAAGEFGGGVEVRELLREPGRVKFELLLSDT
jgi:hypothetical protein